MLQYGDISPAVAAYSVVRMLKRAIRCFSSRSSVRPTSCRPIRRRPRSSVATTWTGATGTAGNGSGNFSQPTATTPLVEGVTPSGSTLTNQDYTVQLAQYGDFITITDVILDTHTDDPRQMTDILGEEAATTVETLRFNVLKAGTNVFYANSVAGRSSVVAAIALADFAACDGAQPPEREEDHFGGGVHGGLQHEVGRSRVHGGVPPGRRNRSALDQRPSSRLRTTDRTPRRWKVRSARSSRFASSPRRSSHRSRMPVAPRVRCARLQRHQRRRLSDPDLCARCLRYRSAQGQEAMTPMVVNPKPAAGDPLAQRGTVGWKLWTATVILQDLFMARLEVAAPLNW
jgi:hypothetical protein